MKIIGLPKDKNYKFVLTATGEGTMNILYENTETNEYTNFYDVPLAENVQYTQQINTSSETIPPLEASDGTKIQSDESFGSQDAPALVTINTNAPDNGSVYGGGQYVKGDSVMLSATANNGYKFIGWYENDTLISLQGFFRFTAMNDRTVEARFEKNLSELTSPTWKVSEAYADNALFWTYKDGDCLDIEFSLYTENSSTKAVLCYADDADKELTLESEDGIHYLMNDISVNELKSITLYDSNSDEIAALDYAKSGNGSGETEVPSEPTTEPSDEIPLGDVDNSGVIDAVDASLVLADYAAVQTGKKGKFTDEQRNAADVNGDGSADAIDASKILAYYAYVQTGHKVAFEEFLSNSK